MPKSRSTVNAPETQTLGCVWLAKCMPRPATAVQGLGSLERNLQKIMGLSSLECEIVLDEPNRLFTSGDFIKGVAHLRLKKDMAISSLVIGVRCTVSAIVPVGQNQCDSEHRHLYQQVSHPFPDAALRANSQGTVFTLAEGTYSYPFSFVLPSSANLPQTYERLESGGSGVFWYVKAKIRRPGKLSSAPRARVRFDFSPALSTIADPGDRKTDENFIVYQALKDDVKSNIVSRLSQRGRFPIKVDSRITFPTEGIHQAPIPSGLGFELESDHPGHVVVKKITIYLEEFARLYTRRRRHRSGVVMDKHHVASIDTNTVLGKVTNFDELVSNVQITMPIAGTIDQPNISVTYQVVFEISLATKSSPNKRKSFFIKAPIGVHSRQATILPAYGSLTPLTSASPPQPEPSLAPPSDLPPPIDAAFSSPAIVVPEPPEYTPNC